MGIHTRFDKIRWNLSRTTDYRVSTSRCRIGRCEGARSDVVQTRYLLKAIVSRHS